MVTAFITVVGVAATAVVLAAARLFFSGVAESAVLQIMAGLAGTSVAVAAAVVGSKRLAAARRIQQTEI